MPSFWARQYMNGCGALSMRSHIRLKYAPNADWLSLPPIQGWARIALLRRRYS